MNNTINANLSEAADWLYITYVVVSDTMKIFLLFLKYPY